MPIRVVRGAEHDDVALGNELLGGDEARVGRERVRGHHASPAEQEQLPQLERERVPRVVDLALEGHPENPDRLRPKVVFGGVAGRR